MSATLNQAAPHTHQFRFGTPLKTDGLTPYVALLAVVAMAAADAPDMAYFGFLEYAQV